MPDWEHHFNLCKKASDEDNLALVNQVIINAQRDISKNDKSDWNWFVDALADTEKKYFVSSVLRFASVPRVLIVPLLQAAIAADASSNKLFLMPCVATYGKEKIASLLMEIKNSRTDEKRSSIKRLLYWLNSTDFRKNGIWNDAA